MDFGKTVALGSAELAFFADGGTFAAPRKVRVEAWRDGRWQAVATPAAAPLANGVTRLTWAPVQAERIRVVMTPAGKKAIRLAELKAFAR